MTHLALPDVPDPHLWLAEGIATYVEPIARVQAGDLTAAKIWGDMVRDMPKGLPEQGDRGLDRTPTWGRTYWGGAMFCLLADVEIRKQTGNKFGLQQALRGIVEAGGDMEQVWPIERIFKVGDQATGTTVLSDLYEKMRAQPYAPDLDALWRELGIVVRGGRVTFDDSAPIAAIRQAITAKPATAPN
jgi:predicted metalloprotease with PDZ domain